MINYFLYLSILACLLILLVYWRSQKYNQSIKTNLDFGMVILLSGFIGARLFHVIYEEPAYYLKQPMHIFYFWYGGFVFYGGAFTGLMAGYIFCKKNEIELINKLNFFTPLFAVGYGLGRVACLISGCCYGKYCDLVICRLNTESRFPTQLLAVGTEFVILGILQSFKSVKFFENNLFYFYLILHGIGRIIMEHFRDDFRGNQYLNVSISTWISYFIIGLGFTFISSNFFKSIKK